MKDSVGNELRALLVHICSIRHVARCFWTAVLCILVERPPSCASFQLLIKRPRETPRHSLYDTLNPPIILHCGRSGKPKQSFELPFSHFILWGLSQEVKLWYYEKCPPLLHLGKRCVWRGGWWGWRIQKPLKHLLWYTWSSWTVSFLHQCSVALKIIIIQKPWGSEGIDIRNQPSHKQSPK